MPINVRNAIIRAKETTEKRINMKDKVINDCQVFFGIIDEGDNNDTLLKRKKIPIFSP